MAKVQKVLILSENASLSEALGETLHNAKFSTHLLASLTEVISSISNNDFNLILIDLSKDPISSLEKLLKHTHSIPVLAMAKEPSTDLIVNSIKLGALDFLQMPFSPEELLEKVKYHVEKLRPQSSPSTLIAESPKMKEVLELAMKVSKFSTPVFINGESGSGKEILANYIHSISGVKGEFIGVNCASISKTLFESEFFGHEQGAFTGATQSKEGFFESANNGTLFLDEISELPNSSQAKLLRALQEKKNRRVGSLKSKDVEVRIISASNINLEQLVNSKNFRDDLFYRINVFGITIPALRERKEDIIPLAKLFMEKQSKALNIKHPYLAKEVEILLEGYSWPGNVRELENTIERAMILSNGEITKESMNLGAQTSYHELPENFSTLNLSLLAESAKRMAETKAILEVLTKEGGNKSKCAERLGVSYKTLLSKIKEYGLEGQKVT